MRDTLNLSEGAKLMVEVRGQELVLSKQAKWKSLHGAGAGKGLMNLYAAEKRREREREDARP